MKSHRYLSFVALLALGGAGLLTGCTGDAPDTSAPESPPSYLDKVGPDGLIEGKSLNQLKSELIFECLQEAGWTNLVLDPDGSFGGHVPEEQADKYASDQIRCVEQVEADYPTLPMSDRGIRERYAFEVETRQCLIEQGYAISEPPSEQMWVEQFIADPGNLWLPYGEVHQTNITEATEAELKVACPDPGERVYAE